MDNKELAELITNKMLEKEKITEKEKNIYLANTIIALENEDFEYFKSFYDIFKNYDNWTTDKEYLIQRELNKKVLGYSYTMTKEERQKYFYNRFNTDCGLYLMRAIDIIAESGEDSYYDICARLGMCNSESLDFLDAYCHEEGWCDESGESNENDNFTEGENE